MVEIFSRRAWQGSILFRFLQKLCLWDHRPEERSTCSENFYRSVSVKPDFSVMAPETPLKVELWMQVLTLLSGGKLIPVIYVLNDTGVLTSMADLLSVVNCQYTS